MTKQTSPSYVTHGANGGIGITELNTGERWQLNNDQTRQFIRAFKLGTQGGRKRR
jgi:hypothetical protein